MAITSISSGHIPLIMGAIRSVPVPGNPIHNEPPKVEPFITISREPGAGGILLARDLVAALNNSASAEEQWTCWDRELIEKVAADLHVSSRLIDSLEDREHSWFTEFLESLAMGQDSAVANETLVYQRVARTIRALALTGRVVVVGRGGVFLTHKMPGGIHLRLVAPMQQRVDFIAREFHMAPDRAAVRIREIERHRRQFYHRYWPNESLEADTFTLTFNTAEVPSATILQTVSSLVNSKTAVRK